MLSLPDFKYKQIVIHFAEAKDEKLCFRADNIIIQDNKGKTLLKHTCHRIFALFIIGEISITSVLVKHSILYHFPIILMNRSLRIIGKFNCIAEGNTLLRQKQYTTSINYKLNIAKYLIEQKIKNQQRLLEKIRNKTHFDKRTIEFLQQISFDDVQDNYKLMGKEGLASKEFFSAYFHRLQWYRREPRCKRDIPNLLLDIGYTLLFQFVETLLSLYGFDLYCGVLHTFFYQRKSLVCDIIEPFRCIIDERIRKAHNLGQIDISDFDVKQGVYYLKYQKQKKYISLFFKDILAYKEEMFKFCQLYYRCFIREKPIYEFPIFMINKGS